MGSPLAFQGEGDRAVIVYANHFHGRVNVR